MEHISNLIAKRANKIMTTKSQELVKRATAEGAMPVPRLQLVIQITDEEGKKKGVKGTGPHEVKFISDKVVKGRDYQTHQERLEVEYIFEEDGQKKRYSRPIKDKQGKLHYFVQRMAEAKVGETIVLEYKKKPGSFQGYIDFRRALEPTPVDPTPIDEVPDSEIPVIEEEVKEVKKVPLAEGGEISMEEIEF